MANSGKTLEPRRVVVTGVGAITSQGPTAQALWDNVRECRVAIRPVECLSACDNGCNIALSAPGRWSYVYGHMDPDLHVADILAGAAAYAAAADGLVPWRDRPQIFRKQSLARIPPLEPIP